MAKKTAIIPKAETETAVNAAKTAPLIPNTGRLEQAEVSKDGINIKNALGALKLVDVADVDLLLTFANGERIVIPNGALEAVSSTPPIASFNDQKIALPELLKYVGLTYQAKPGSLRLVSENIDANPPTDIDTSDREPTPVSPPPAPVVKVSPGTGVGKGLANGLGDVPETYNPLVVAQPSVYRVGKSSATPINDIIKGTPNIEVAVYTANQLKVANQDSSSLGNPYGAYDPALENSAAGKTLLALKSSPQGQSTRDAVQGTSGDDTITANANFLGNIVNGSFTPEAQWSKTIHATINNFSSIDTATLSIDPSIKLLSMPGFNLSGNGISHVAGTNTWTIDPAVALAGPMNININYNINETGPDVDFVLNVNVLGKTGPLVTTFAKQLYFTYRNVDTNQSDFTVTDSTTGTQMYVLPRTGLGMKFNTGDGADTIYAGAGNDILIGGTGGDNLHGGAGSDTASYEDTSNGIIASLLSPSSNTGDAIDDTYDSIENLTGGSGNDTLEGNSSANVLDGGIGIDTASYEHSNNTVKASLTNPSTFNSGDAWGDTYINIENLTGGSGDDTLEGNMEANIINGGAGVNTVSFANATAGIVTSLTNNSKIHTDNGNLHDAAYGDTYVIDNDTHLPTIQNLTGSQYDDVLEGNAGANKFIGYSGSVDLGVIGDTVTYEHSNSSSVSVSLSATAITNGFITTGDAVGDAFIRIKNLIGTSGNDTFVGDSQNNTINGGAGIDTINYKYETASGVTVNLITGVATSTNPLASTTIGTDTLISIENIIGSDVALKSEPIFDKNSNRYANDDTVFDDIITGSTDSLDINKASNNINAGAGNDKIVDSEFGTNYINGGAGDDLIVITSKGEFNVDTIDGGDGDNDTLKLASSTVRGIINLKTGTFSEGTGTQISFSNIENFIDATGNSVDYVYASDKANYIVATSATYDGSKNTIDYSLVSGQVEIDLFHETATRIGTLDIDTIINFNQAVGSKFADTITGNANANNLNGGAGNDELKGGDGNDYLTGGTGDDKLYGEAGDDTLDGGGGADTFSGGQGTDTVTYASATAGVKADMRSTTSAYANTNETGDAKGDLFDGLVENLTGSNYDDTLIGDNNSNVINGGAGNDIIMGGKGDTLYGGAGDDIFKLTVGDLPAFTNGEANSTTPSRGDQIEISNLGNAFNLSNLVSTSTTGASTLSTGIETLNIRETSFSIAAETAKNTNISLSVANINQITGLSGTSPAPILTILANNGDNITLTGSSEHWASTFNAAQSNTYTIYNSSNVAAAIINWQVA